MKTPDVAVEITCSHDGWTSRYDFLCHGAKPEKCEMVTDGGNEEAIVHTASSAVPTKLRISGMGGVRY